jgi:hypothetical protein
MYSGLREFFTQRNLSHISPLECLVFKLHDLSPHGKILEADTWPNQEGDTCHVLTDTPILHMLKNYRQVAHVPCVHIIQGDVRKPHHFRILGFRNINPQLHFPPKCADFCCMSSWIEWLRFTSDLQGLEISIINFSLLAFSQSDFTQITRSVDVCPPTDRWSPTTSSLRRFVARVITCHIVACLSICGGMNRRFGVTCFSPCNSPDADM